MPFGATSNFTLEICCSDLESARAAEKNGADRIELCQNLEQGGVTPSYGLIKKCVEQLKIPVHVLIRPRPGHFGYQEDELQVMFEDIAVCKELGCAGVVVGFADAEWKVNQALTRAAVEAAGSMAVTYHRAFDDICDEDPGSDRALEAVIDAGCSRLLTSGRAQTAEEGIDQIKRFVEQAQGRIVIMPGSGVSPENVKQIIQHTGVREVHTSAKHIKKHVNKKRRSGLFEADQIVVDGSVVAKMVEALERIDIETLPSSPAARKQIKICPP